MTTGQVDRTRFQRLKLKYDELLSIFAFNFSLRRCSEAESRWKSIGAVTKLGGKVGGRLVAAGNVKTPAPALTFALNTVTEDGSDGGGGGGGGGSGAGGGAGSGKGRSEVGRCRLTVSNPVLKVPTVSALETGISRTAFIVCFQFNLRHHSEGGENGDGAATGTGSVAATEAAMTLARELSPPPTPPGTDRGGKTSARSSARSASHSNVSSGIATHAPSKSSSKEGGTRAGSGSGSGVSASGVGGGSVGGAASKLLQTKSLAKTWKTKAKSSAVAGGSHAVPRFGNGGEDYLVKLDHFYADHGAFQNFRTPLQSERQGLDHVFLLSWRFSIFEVLRVTTQAGLTQAMPSADCLLARRESFVPETT